MTMTTKQIKSALNWAEKLLEEERAWGLYSSDLVRLIDNFKTYYGV